MTEQKIKHKTPYNNYFKPSNGGNPIQNEYIEVITDNGEAKLKKTGQTNLYQQIQHEGEGVSIKEMLERYNYNFELLKEKAQNMNYSDTTEFSNNKLENLEKIENIEVNINTVRNTMIEQKKKELEKEKNQEKKEDKDGKAK